LLTFHFQIKRIIRGGTTAQLLAERDRVYEEFIAFQEMVAQNAVVSQAWSSSKGYFILSARSLPRRPNATPKNGRLDRLDYSGPDNSDHQAGAQPVEKSHQVSFCKTKSVSDLKNLFSILNRMCEVFLNDVHPLPLLYDLAGLPRFQALFAQLYRQSDISQTLVFFRLSSYSLICPLLCRLANGSDCSLFLCLTTTASSLQK
jgi:hypothetical protein